MYRFVLLILSCFLVSSMGWSQQYSDSVLTGNNKISSILILGNSITYHKEKPSIGWYGNWGMAASSEKKDFLHLLAAKLSKKNPSIKLNFATIGNTFERKFWNMDSSEIKKSASFNPDIIILKIGENIKDGLAEKQELSIQLEKLVSLVDPENKARIIIAGSFWPNKMIEGQFKKASKKNNWLYVSMEGLYANKKNTAFGKFSNQGVGRHPSDEGMKNIAERIWSTLDPILK